MLEKVMTTYDDGPNGEKMINYMGYSTYTHFFESFTKPYKHQLPCCKVTSWSKTGCLWRKNGIVTGGEKWMCKGYATDTPGQLNKEDKAKRAQWKTIE